MRHIIHKCFSLFLVLAILVSTTSFSIDKHFCGEHLVDVAIFSNAQPCAMEVALEAKYGPEHTKKSDCCSNEKTIIEGQDELKVQFDQFDYNNVVFIKTFFTSYQQLFAIGEQNSPSLGDYPPPLVVTDFQILYDQFLI